MVETNTALDHHREDAGAMTFGVIRAMGYVLNRMKMYTGTTFEGVRDLFKALGYKRSIGYADYYARYRRGDIAARLVEIFPKATWAAGCEVLEVQDPEEITDFEKACATLDDNIHFWNHFLRADILAGIEEYAVLYIGAPGNPSKELKTGKGDPSDIAYLMPYRKGNAQILTLVTDIYNPRFGQPETYNLYYQAEEGIGSPQAPKTLRVHWTRVIHVADNLLESNITGMPRLENIWNRLDDLDKVVGGGSEAFWKTVYQGLQLDVDKDMDLDETAKKELSQQIDEFEANMRRVFRTRGVTANPLGVQVADFGKQMHAIIDIICATKGIPKRIFMGSERGELASAQDKASWDDEIDDRRAQFAWPRVVKPFIDRLLEYNYLPHPKDDKYFVQWPERTKSTPTEQAVIAQRLATLNKSSGQKIIAGSDIRERVLGWDPLTDDQLKEIPDPNELAMMGKEVGPPPEGQPSKSKQSGGDTAEVRKKA